MASVSTFTEMMEQFLDELALTFPEQKSIKKYATSFQLVKKSNPRKCVESYIASVSPYSEHIMQKNDAFFIENAEKIPMFKEMNFKNNWTDENLSQNTKDAIWQYLQTLFILGTTITAIPTETLSMIEGVAKQCAANMQGNEGEEGAGGLDEKALMSSMSGLMSALGGGSGDGGNILSQLLGGGEK